MKKLFVYGAEVLKDKDDNDYVLLSLLAEEDGVMASGMYSKAIFENAKTRTGFLYKQVEKRLKGGDKWEGDIDDQSTWITTVGEVVTLDMRPHYVTYEEGGRKKYRKDRKGEKAISNRATVVMLPGETVNSLRASLESRIDEEDFVEMSDDSDE